jgi:hypothetical protein
VEMPAYELLPASARPALANAETVWNVAYGSNLSLAKLTSRAPDGRAKITPLAHLPVTVPGYSLRFSLAAVPPIEPVMADALATADGPVLHGVAYQLTKTDYDSLCMSEHCATAAMPASYIEVPVSCCPYGGGAPFHATMFVVARERAHCGATLAKAARYRAVVHPSARYMALIRGGARAAGLDPDYLRWLDRLPVARPVRSPVMRLLAELALAGVFFLFQSNALRPLAALIKYQILPHYVELYARREEAAAAGRPVLETVRNALLLPCLAPLALFGVFNIVFVKARVLLRE